MGGNIDTSSTLKIQDRGWWVTYYCNNLVVHQLG